MTEERKIGPTEEAVMYTIKRYLEMVGCEMMSPQEVEDHFGDDVEYARRIDGNLATILEWGIKSR